MAERPRWLQSSLSASSRGDFPIVAIGASAGGLDACRKLLDALPAHNGMAFIIVQHLDPSHNSMMVDLLAGHMSMPVLLATDGMKIERERVYVIYLSVDEKGGLRLSKPLARHGARLPFDFLLNSLAREYGARAVCVVLSGTGADGASDAPWQGPLTVAPWVREVQYRPHRRNRSSWLVRPRGCGITITR
jgi:two-component system, chemotaxis family, CheB/CheR fusion protein